MLRDDLLCAVYEERFLDPSAPDYETVGYFVSKSGQLKPFICGRIELLIRDGALPKWIQKQCCYAHPELLEEYETSDLKPASELVQIGATRSNTGEDSRDAKGGRPAEGNQSE